MPNRPPPKYRHYQPKNLAVVRIDGTDHYLGTYGSPESWEKYHRLLAERLAVKSDRLSFPRPAATSELSINELLNAFRVFAEGNYVKDGKPTQELSEMKWAAQPLRALYGHTPATEFGPLSLKAVREHMTSVQGLSRNVANHRIGRIKRIFKWGVSEELVPGSVLEALRSVDGLRYGRTNARETEPVKPVEQSHVEAVLLSVAPQVAAMIQLQMLTAMRPGEVVVMRAADIDIQP
jgi:integrase